MAPDFRSYLATQLIAEKQSVSYRNVARALKVHANSAKCMLYDFWEKENKKKTGSIYATYLIAGTKKQEDTTVYTNGHSKHVDEDEPMPSSPPPFTSSMLDPSQRSQRAEVENVPVKTITLVREEDVDTIKAQYDTITSIHIYSLSPGRLEDLVTLTDIGRGVFVDTFSKEDPLTSNKVYGVIQNPGVRRRKGKRPANVDAPAPKFQPSKEEKDVKKSAPNTTTTSTTTTKNDDKEVSRPGSRDSNASVKSDKNPTLKREGSSLFKAFSKAQNKIKLDRKDTDATTNTSASGAEDLKMADADEEGESEDDALFLDTGTKKAGSKKRSSEVQKERQDKQAKLRKMMDSDDEEEKAVPNVEEAAGLTNEKPMAKKSDDQDDENNDVAWSDSDTEKQQKNSSSKDASNTKDEEEQATTEPKRRRGRRKVTKKRTMRDEDGYLVTKEEDAWESFSEDEPVPPKEKPKSAFSSMKSQPASQKSTAGAKGGTQKKKGDIMSFFGKK